MQIITLNSCDVSECETISLEEKKDCFLTYEENKLKFPLSKFIDKFDNNSKIIIPKFCRFMNTSRNCNWFVIEEEPCVRTIRVIFENSNFEKYRIWLKNSGKYDELELDYTKDTYSTVVNFNLSFPYIIYIIFLKIPYYYSSTYVFFRLQPLTSIYDNLIIPSLTNINKSCNLCTGLDTTNFSKLDVQERINRIVASFWDNKFNHDYQDNYNSYNNTFGISNYFEWMHKSNIDPLFIFKYVEWNKHRYNLKQVINLYFKNSDDSDNPNFNVNIINLFRRNIISKSIFLEGNEIFIGDSLILNSKSYFIYDIIENKFILEDENGIRSEVIPSEISTEITNYIVNKKELLKFDVGGETFKIGDIIYIYFPETKYEKIEDIIKTSNGVEIKCEGKNEWTYIIKNIRFKKFNLSDLFGSSTIVKGNKYLVKFSDYFMCFSSVRMLEFSETFISKGEILFTFLDSDLSLSRSISPSNIISSYKTLETPLIARGVNYLFLNKNIKNYKNFYIDRSRCKIYMNNILYSLCNIKDNVEYKQSIFNEENIEKAERMFIPGADFDIEFSVGDKVVYANWDSPSEMTTIYEIKSFSQDENFIYVNIVSGMIEKKVQYINFSNSRINIGIIRHIIPEYNGIQAGEYIKSIKRVKCFPQSKSFKVIGFLNDTNTNFPLMLCSNNLTQWASPNFLSNFEISRNKSIIKKFSNEFETSPLKYIQPGDMVSNSDLEHGFVVSKGHVSIRNTRKCFPTIINELGDIYLQEPKLHGFLTPRYSDIERNRFKNYYGLINFHGGFNVIDSEYILSSKPDMIVCFFNFPEEHIVYKN